MKASELIKDIQEAIKKYGDLEMYDSQLDEIMVLTYIYKEKHMDEGFYLNIG